MPSSPDPIPARIFQIRDHRVILDSDLARLYGVPTFRLNEAAKRNAGKFPRGFSVPTDTGRAHRLDIAKCDIKFVCL